MEVTKSFGITTHDADGFTIDSILTGLTIQMILPGDITIASGSPMATSKFVNQMSNIYFDMTLPFIYSTGGYLVITFPPEVILSNQITCRCDLGFSITPTSPCTCSFIGSSSS